MRYREWFEDCFAEIEEKYNTQILVVDDDEVALVAKTYILFFLVHMGTVHVSYVYRQPDGELMEVDIDHNITKSVIKQDYADLPPTRMTFREEAEDEILITARCLARRWDDLLRGETAWMTDPGRIVVPMERNVPYRIEASFAEQFI